MSSYPQHEFTNQSATSCCFLGSTTLTRNSIGGIGGDGSSSFLVANNREEDFNYNNNNNEGWFGGFMTMNNKPFFSKKTIVEPSTLKTISPTPFGEGITTTSTTTVSEATRTRLSDSNTDIINKTYNGDGWMTSHPEMTTHSRDTSSSEVVDQQKLKVWDNIWNLYNHNNTTSQGDWDDVGEIIKNTPRQQQFESLITHPNTSMPALNSDVQDGNGTTVDNGGEGKVIVVDEIAHALNELSFEERQDVYDDIHGVPRTSHENSNNNYDNKNALNVMGGGGGRRTGSIINPETIENEDPSFVKNCLDEMYREILKQFWTSKNSSSSSSSNSPSSTSALRYVMEHEPTYIEQNINFRLSFLRSEEFHSMNAAMKLVNFLQCKAELFGLHRVTKNITLHDDYAHEDDDLQCLQSGGLQHVPLTDQSGRNIVIRVSKLENIKTDENMVRIKFV